MQNCISIRHRGWSGQISSFPLFGFFESLSFFFGFLVTRTGRTSGPILTIDTSYDVFPRKDVLFGGCLDNTCTIDKYNYVIALVFRDYN